MAVRAARAVEGTARGAASGTGQAAHGTGCLGRPGGLGSAPGAAGPQGAAHGDRDRPAQRHIAEAGLLVDETGQIQVAADYRPEVGGREVRLKKRLYAARDRYTSYPPDLQALFTGLGLPWADAADTERASD